MNNANTLGWALVFAAVAASGCVPTGTSTLPPSNVQPNSTSNAELLSAKDEAKRAQAEARLAVTNVTNMKTSAQAASDFIRLDCVNDKLMQLNGKANDVDKAADDVGVAVDAFDATKTNESLAQVKKLSSDVTSLTESANACAGRPTVLYAGGSQTDWNTQRISDPGTLKEQSDRKFNDEDPIYASPYL